MRSNDGGDYLYFRNGNQLRPAFEDHFSIVENPGLYILGNLSCYNACFEWLQTVR